MAHYNSFIVRIWSGRDSPFRGQIVHVATQEKAYFRDADRMIQFILERLGRSAILEDNVGTVPRNLITGSGEGNDGADQG